MATVKKYPVIGGPIDGAFANMQDFWDAHVSAIGPQYDRERGAFCAHAKDYVRYNAGVRRAPASSIFLWRPLIPGARRVPQ